MSNTPSLTIPQALELARAHHQAGRLAQAETIYRRILVYDPNHADVINLLGMLAMQSGQHDAAIALLRRATALSPKNPDFINNLGSALLNGGRQSEALETFKQASLLSPNTSFVYFNLGNAHKAAGQIDDAILCYEKALALDPANIGALNNMGTALKNRGRFAEAIACFRRLIAIDPQLFWAHNNLGEALRRQNDLDDAERCWRRAIELNPDYATAHWNLGTLLLLRGNFQDGWQQYAWRTREGNLGFLHKPSPAQMWDGSELNGRTILVQAEQGLGDTIQFIRYLPILRQRGPRIIFACQPELVELFRGQFDVDQWITERDQTPQCDVQCLLLNLPMLLGTILSNIPANIPYLAATTHLKNEWGKKLSGVTGMKVGIAWAGKPAYSDDRNRSMDWSLLAPLLSVPNISLLSLQKGEAARQIAGNAKILDLTGDLPDFANTAALIANLDLVITVDTAVAHLAGAMGKPVWVLLPIVPDWRWMLGRADSPWYPTMRLHRQQNIGDWSAPVRQIAGDLSTLATAKRSPHPQAVT